MALIPVTSNLAIDQDEIVESFIRASGPGGQHVNKTSSAVELRFDVEGSPTLPEGVKARLAGIAGRRLNREGVLVITADEHRSQQRNRDNALGKLVDLIRQATIRPRIRRPTKPTLASKKRRLDGKARRSTLKSSRGKDVEGGTD